MILLGTDVSGHFDTDRHGRYIAVVFGTEEGINRAYRRIGVKQIHMTTLRKTEQDMILDRLKFDNDVVAVCAYVELQQTIDCITNDPAFGTKPTRKAHGHFGYLFWKCMRETIETFAFERRCETREIVAQCDSDMSGMASKWGMEVKYKGKAYELADVVGWCNTHRRHLKTCKEMDFRDQIRDGMKRDLL